LSYCSLRFGYSSLPAAVAAGANISVSRRAHNIVIILTGTFQMSLAAAIMVVGTGSLGVVQCVAAANSLTHQR